MPKKVLISGYTYVDGSATKTFDYYPSEKDIYFLVPDEWPFKGGKYVTRPPKQGNIQMTKAFFHHSNYPIIGGILKGWMPIFPLVLVRRKPDIVFSASEPNLLTTLYQGVFSKLSGAKHVIFTWENIPYQSKFRGLKGILQRGVVRLNLYFCDALVCGSYKSEQVIKTLTNKPTAVMPFSGIDTEFFTRNSARKSFKGVNYDGSIVFSFAGAIGYRKGIHLVIKAFKEISGNIDNSFLFVAGSGEYEKEIDTLIKESGLGDKIIRVSWLDRDGLRELLNASDIFLYPSIPYGGWEEQFGYSLAEASSMELPVVSTKSGSISEVVLDGKTGILIKPDDAQVLKEAMLELAGNKEKRVSMGRTGRQFVSENYSRKVVADKYYKFFNSI